MATSLSYEETDGQGGLLGGFYESLSVVCPPPCGLPPSPQGMREPRYLPLLDGTFLVPLPVATTQITQAGCPPSFPGLGEIGL